MLTDSVIKIVRALAHIEHYGYVEITPSSGAVTTHIIPSVKHPGAYAVRDVSLRKITTADDLTAEIAHRRQLHEDGYS